MSQVYEINISVSAFFNIPGLAVSDYFLEKHVATSGKWRPCFHLYFVQ